MDLAGEVARLNPVGRCDAHDGRDAARGGLRFRYGGLALGERTVEEDLALPRWVCRNAMPLEDGTFEPTFCAGRCRGCKRQAMCEYSISEEQLERSGQCVLRGLLRGPVTRAGYKV